MRHDLKDFACSAKNFRLEMIDDYLAEQCHNQIWAFGRLLCQQREGQVGGKTD